MSFIVQLREGRANIARYDRAKLFGHVTVVSSLSAEVDGLGAYLTVGDRLELRCRGSGTVVAEVVGTRQSTTVVAPFSSTLGIGCGAPATVGISPAANPRGAGLAPCDGWLGRVVDPLGTPLDGRGPLPPGRRPAPLRAAPPAANSRARLGPRIDLGVRALNCFAPCRMGQRLGLFAGSGIGKSTLLSMLARNTACDVVVLALVGERGREVREFLEDDLGPEGSANAVVVVATSDAPPLLRREAGYAALTIAEHFRDRGKSVLLLMDSVTRFCLALRELGLAAGEPPATRGYPPSVFAELPRLLERAGPGPRLADGRNGHITAMFTVLVEGDDHDEPVADAVRGILDGHVILDRRIGEAGRYPAIDVLRSLSRSAPGCLDAPEVALVRRARAILALYAEMADMVRLGAYKQGTDPSLDEAVRLAPRIEAILAQPAACRADIRESFAALAAAIGDPIG